MMVAFIIVGVWCFCFGFFMGWLPYFWWKRTGTDLFERRPRR